MSVLADQGVITEIQIEEISPANQHDLNLVDGTFIIDSVLDVAATSFGDTLHFKPVAPCEKTYPPDSLDIPAYIGSNDGVMYLAYADGVIAGQIVLKRNWNRLAWIQDIEVDRSFRRQGIGKALVDRAVDWARQHDFPAVMLETQDTNGPACRFYHSYGFRIGGYDRYLYAGTPYAADTAIFWYYFL